MEYRGWRVWLNRSAFYAHGSASRPSGCTLTSRNLRRLYRGIDRIEGSLTGNDAPVWFLFALVFPDADLIDLDAVEDPDLRNASSTRSPR